MRDVKFRAWDKELSRMLKKSDIHKEAHCLAVFLDGEIRDVAFGRIDEGPVNEDFVLMQYTGLKDKNGQEIYEGDILKFNGNCQLAVVSWCADGARFIIDERVGLYDMIVDQIAEVIGNVYENPELLEPRT